MSWLRRGASSLFFRTAAAAAMVFGSVVPAAAGPVVPDWTQWTGATDATWGTASNWETNVSTNVVPSSTLSAILPGTVPVNSSITLGAGAQAKTLFVDALGYTLHSGDLTLADQLWIQQTGGAGLTLASSGTITTVNATLGADAGKSGQLTLNSAGGAVATTISGAMQIGVAGGSSGVYLSGTSNTASLSAGTIQLGFGSTSSANHFQALGPHTITAGTLQVGVDGADNDVILGNGGTLSVTGANDLAIGIGATASGNSVYAVGVGSSVSVVKNVVVGVSGTGNQFMVNDGATAVSGGARIGVDAGATGNAAAVGLGSTWTMDGTVRLGDSGSGNYFLISGGTVTLTGAGKNFYVGYGNTASNNVLALDGAGSKLVVRDAAADLVVSANLTSGSTATGNLVGVTNGAIIDATRTIIGNGGTLVGMNGGTVKSNVLVGTGGLVAPGDGTDGTIGTLAIDGNLDLAPSISPFTGQVGRLDIDISGSQIDQISVSGLLNIAGSTLHFDTSGWDGQTHVFATYGSLNGTFGVIEGLPAGASLNYAYLGNQIALVVPEIGMAGLGGVVALVGGALGLLERRRKRS